MPARPSVPPLDPDGVGTNAPSSQPKKVAYFYDGDAGNYAYPTGHYMKPYRIRMAHSLVMNYGVHNKMEVFRAQPATRYEMTKFHTDEYIDFLCRVTPYNQDQHAKELAKFNVGEDCPVFDGLFEFCAISAGGSMEGAARLNREMCDVAINWAGGLHHAKKNEASGFCYVNDIVLSILELLRFHRRVLYIDIDVHHGDGVEEAFYTTDRVMCVSFHKFGHFFPGTGDVGDVGIGAGRNYSINFPLNDGIDDETYKDIFESVIGWTMDFYRPDAIVLQCGADSLSGDRLGAFNLSMRGHANCVNFVKKYNKPLLILGGGGYTIKNVARVWAYETGQLVGMDLEPQMPFTDYYEFYAPDFELDVKASNMDNFNSAQYIAKVKSKIYEHLREIQSAPSVQMQTVPRYPLGMGVEIDELEDELNDEDEDAELSKESRYSQRMLDKKIEREDEFFAEASGLDPDTSAKQSRNYRIAGSLDVSQRDDGDGDEDLPTQRKETRRGSLAKNGHTVDPEPPVKRGFMNLSPEVNQALIEILDSDSSSDSSD